jgi:hypothetical protein
VNRTAILRGLGIAVCATAVLMTLQSLLAAPASVRHLRKKNEDVEALRSLREDQARSEAAIDLFEKLPSRTPPPLGELVNIAMPGARYNLRLKESRPAPFGWMVRSVELSFEDLPLASLAPFLERAENRRPPWRLVECHLTASDQAPGRGRAVLVLEGIEKTGAVRSPADGDNRLTGKPQKH